MKWNCISSSHDRLNCRFQADFHAAENRSRSLRFNAQQLWSVSVQVKEDLTCAPERRRNVLLCWGKSCEGCPVGWCLQDTEKGKKPNLSILSPTTLLLLQANIIHLTSFSWNLFQNKVYPSSNIFNELIDLKLWQNKEQKGVSFLLHINTSRLTAALM